TEVPKPSLISPIKVKKSTLENFEAVRQREQKESTPSPNIEPIDKDFVDEVREKIWANKTTPQGSVIPDVEQPSVELSVAENAKEEDNKVIEDQHPLQEPVDESHTDVILSTVRVNDENTEEEDNNVEDSPQKTIESSVAIEEQRTPLEPLDGNHTDIIINKVEQPSSTTEIQSDDEEECKKTPQEEIALTALKTMKGK
ncbi:hypothetical protein AB4431_08180, partial [Vibrio artabrorum]